MVAEQLIPGGVSDVRVLEVMAQIPRHCFVPQGFEAQSYLDRPTAIGEAQTISQPLIVGLMTQALRLKGTEKILEIGTGSGYQTAILGKLAKKVYSVERLPNLSNRARKILYQLNYKNIQLRIGDGTLGWPEEGPFDAILVTAASPQMPSPLKEQLVEGGRLIIPVGSEEEQELVEVTRTEKGFSEKVLSDCRFVKLVGEHGWSK